MDFVNNIDYMARLLLLSVIIIDDDYFCKNASLYYNAILLKSYENNQIIKEEYNTIISVVYCGLA